MRFASGCFGEYMTIGTLTDTHLAQLTSSAISPQVRIQRGYVSVRPGAIQQWRELAGAIHSDKLLKTVLHDGGLAFPLYRLGAEEPFTWVLRPDRPRHNQEGKVIKYEYPKGEKNVFDCLPAYRMALRNPQIPLWITEGAKKADALASAAGKEIVPLNENGVWGWRAKGRLAEDWQGIIWEGRDVVIAPDGDVRHNKQVWAAIKRTAQVLLGLGAFSIRVLLLPQEKDGPKLGVDDYLGLGHGWQEVQQHLVDLETVGQEARTSLMKHPKTGAPLFLPPGYDIQHKNLVVSTPAGSQSFYRGLVIVSDVGKNLHTEEETATVMWTNNGHFAECSLPRAQLASSRHCAEALAARGAYIHAGNAREMSKYVIEFIAENYDAIPRTDYVDRLGVCGEGLVLPAGYVSMRPVKYAGASIEVGTDHQAYQRVLAEVAQWQQTSVLWGVFALALAGPLLQRLRGGRHPVVLLAGASGSGKSTLAHFGIGAYGDPTRSPLQIQCGSGTTTPKGIQQIIANLNGVPTHLEDVHMLMERDTSRFSGLIYDFANGQLRAYGTLDQKGGGGHEVGGCLLMTGELLPEFAHAGAQKRLLLLNCLKHAPLGVPAESQEGARRATLLDRAWGQGAGSFGLQLCQALWPQVEQLKADISRLSADEALADMQAWKYLFAAAASVLQVAAGLAGIDLDTISLMRRWAAMHQESQKERNPAKEAFERILTMLGQSEETNNSLTIPGTDIQQRASWYWRVYDRKMIAARRDGQNYWRVATGSPQWQQLVGRGMVEQFGTAWLAEGLILAHPDGSLSKKCFMGEQRTSTQCILIPDSVFTSNDDDDSRT